MLTKIGFALEPLGPGSALLTRGSLCLSLALSLSVSRSVSVCLSLASNTQREGSCHALGAPLRAACRHRTRRKPRHMTTRVPTPRALPTQIRTLLTACARARAQRACLQAAPLTLAASAHCLCLYHAQLRARSAARRHAGRGTRSATTAASCNCSFVRSIDGKGRRRVRMLGPLCGTGPRSPSALLQLIRHASTPPCATTLYMASHKCGL